MNHPNKKINSKIYLFSFVASSWRSAKGSEREHAANVDVATSGRSPSAHSTQSAASAVGNVALCRVGVERVCIRVDGRQQLLLQHFLGRIVGEFQIEEASVAPRKHQILIFVGEHDKKKQQLFFPLSSFYQD